MKLSQLASLAVGFLAITHPAFADIQLGDQIELKYLYPSASDVIFDFSVTFSGINDIGYGGPGVAVIQSALIALITTYSSDPLTCYCDEIISNDTFKSASFNGVAIIDLSNQNAFVGWTASADVPQQFSYTNIGNSIFVNYEGAPVVIGTVWLQPNVLGAVPEPSTWAMMLIGFVGLGFAAYRSSRQASPQRCERKSVRISFREPARLTL